MPPYDAPDYWEGLLARGFDESTVGYAQLAVSLNAAMYRSTRDAVRRALVAGGVLIAIEPVVVHRWWGPPFDDRSNSRARPIGVYEQALGEAGLTLEMVRTATALLSNVIDTRTRVAFRALKTYWSLLNRVVGRRETVGAIAASLLGPIDSIAIRLARTGPSAKVLVARRPPAS